MNRFWPHKLLSILLTVFIFDSNYTAFAQAPQISYPTPEIYKVGNNITPISPTNTGGTVPPESYGVSTFAGSTGTGGTFGFINGIKPDGAGNMYVTDNTQRLMKITPDGVLTVIAGQANVPGNSNGQGSAALFNNPGQVATDANGNIYIADQQNNLIRKITTSGLVTTYAGSGARGSADGPATIASFNQPAGLVFDGSGNLYVSDFNTNIIRKIALNGMVSTVAGTAGAAGFSDGQGTSALLSGPSYMAIDANGNIYFSETGNNAIREISKTGNVSTLAGSGRSGFQNGTGAFASFNNPGGIAIDAVGNLFVADQGNFSIRKVTQAGVVTTFAGDGQQGATNGYPLTSVKFADPRDITLDASGNLFVADGGQIRKINVSGYTIDKPLPPGLNFDNTTGTISGTPTAVSPATNYTISAYNISGGSSTVVNIQVDDIVPVVTTSSVTGTITACQGSPSSSPNIGQFTVAGTALTGDIILTPPADFDISLTAIGGYSRSLDLPQNGGTVISTTIYVRLAASATGSPSENIIINTTGASPSTVTVSGTVNSLPVVNNVANQVFTAGNPTSAINFSGTANTFTWTNNNTAIGLPANGTGNINSFIPVNSSGTAISALVTVTPGNSSSGCSGQPIVFNITVNPAALSPGISTGLVNGTIIACAGTASVSPNIQKFTVSGNTLTGNITAKAPAGFEISLSENGGFGNSLSIPESGGIVNNSVIYVRSSASASGNISGNIILSTPGFADQNIAVTGTVYAIPSVNPLPNILVTSGATIPVINFSGTGTIYTWTNDTPGIGLAASGNGDIPAFTCINNSSSPIKATITVIANANANLSCGSSPVTFSITVKPVPPPSISVSGTLKGLTTTYGTNSTVESISLTGANLLAAVVIKAPSGFEVSTDNNIFSSSVNAGSTGSTGPVSVYLRLAAITPAGNNYSGNLVFSSTGTTDVTVAVPTSIVNKASLTIIANNLTKAQGSPNPSFTFTYSGFKNGDQPDQLTALPTGSTLATNNSAVGQYAIQVDGASSPNYTFNYVYGTLTILPSLQFVTIPNAFTPNGDGINDLWNIPQLADYPNCLVSVYSRYGNLVFQARGYGKPWDGTSNGTLVPAGTYYYRIDAGLAGIKPLSGYVAVLR